MTANFRCYLSRGTLHYAGLNVILPSKTDYLDMSLFELHAFCSTAGVCKVALNLVARLPD